MESFAKRTDFECCTLSLEVAFTEVRLAEGKVDELSTLLEDSGRIVRKDSGVQVIIHAYRIVSDTSALQSLITCSGGS